MDSADVSNIKLIILNHLEELSNCLNDEELSKDYSKKDGKINWKKMREILRKELSSELKEEWERMWDEEGLNDKLAALQLLTQNTQSTSKAWRPKTGDINPQKLALEKKKMINEIEHLKKMSKEKVDQVECTKERLSKDWNEIKEIRERISEHMKSMDAIQENMTRELDDGYNQDLLSIYSIDELEKDIQDTTLQGCLHDILL